MAWDRIVTADAVVQRLIEGKGIYQLCNRGYDSLVGAGASSVRRPKLPTLLVKKNTGTAGNSADRKKTKTDTVMVETDLDIYAVPILDELAGKFESNDMLRSEFEVSAAMALQQQFDADVIAAAQAGAHKFNFLGDKFAYEDITFIKRYYTEAKVPEDGRVLIIPGRLEQDFWALPIIQTVTGYNLQVFSNGKFVEMLGFKIFFTSLSDKIGGKENITSFYGPGLAFILSRLGEIKETYDSDLLADVIDLLAHAAAELDGDEFAVTVGDGIGEDQSQLEAVLAA